MKNSYYLILFMFMSIFFFSCIEEEIKNTTDLNCQIENNPEFKLNPKSSQFQEMIDSYVEKGLPGIILLVKDENGFFIGSSGMADIQNGIEVQACHISKIASITKLMLATCIFRLQEKGQLSISDPVLSTFLLISWIKLKTGMNRLPC